MHFGICIAGYFCRYTQCSDLTPDFALSCQLIAVNITIAIPITTSSRPKRFVTSRHVEYSSYHVSPYLLGFTDLINLQTGVGDPRPSIPRFIRSDLECLVHRLRGRKGSV